MNINPQNSPGIVTILSIDIGIKNLGLVLFEATDDFVLKKCLRLELIDITRFHHPGGCQICSLKHEKTICDWMSHVFLTFEDMFVECEVILIERQPPIGLVSVEQSIFTKYRDKCHLVSPNSVHCFHAFKTRSYKKRKIMSEKLFGEFLKTRGSEGRGSEGRSSECKVLREYQTYPRKHDLADAYTQAAYWCAKKRKKKLHRANRIARLQRQTTYKGKRLSVGDLLEKFKYKKEKTVSE